MTDEVYTYDDNGNRIDVDNDAGSTTYTTGANNRLDSDGVYDYEYDGEGNLIKQTEISSGDYRVFEWDHRNRLALISDYDDLDDLQLKVTYLYDAFDRLIGKRVDADGDTDIDRTEAYVYDGNQIVLRFADDDAAALAAADLTNRYLWGPNVDQLLAEENVTSLGSAGTVDWPLTDHQNTIRDWARYSGGSTTILDHAEYDSSGNRLDTPTVDSLFGYTGRYHDPDTGLQYNHHRWYDAPTGRFISEDWIWDDVNRYRYVRNSSTIYVDPWGLAPASPDNPGGGGGVALPPRRPAPPVTRIPGIFGGSIYLNDSYFKDPMGSVPCVVCHGQCARGTVGPPNSFRLPGGPGSLEYYQNLRDSIGLFTIIVGGGTAGGIGVGGIPGGGAAGGGAGAGGAAGGGAAGGGATAGGGAATAEVVEIEIIAQQCGEKMIIRIIGESGINRPWWPWTGTN